MALDFSEILVVGVSSRALFNLEKENEILESLQQIEDKLIFLNKDFTLQFVAKKIKTNKIANINGVEYKFLDDCFDFYVHFCHLTRKSFLLVCV